MFLIVKGQHLTWENHFQIHAKLFQTEWENQKLVRSENWVAANPVPVPCLRDSSGHGRTLGSKPLSLTPKKWSKSKDQITHTIMKYHIPVRILVKDIWWKIWMKKLMWLWCASTPLFAWGENIRQPPTFLHNVATSLAPNFYPCWTLFHIFNSRQF